MTCITQFKAHHQKIYALLLYSAIIFVFIGGNVILWGVKPELNVLDPESRTVYCVCGLFLILSVIGIVLSWQIRRHSLGTRSTAASLGEGDFLTVEGVVGGNISNGHSPSVERMTCITSAIEQQERKKANKRISPPTPPSPPSPREPPRPPPPAIHSHPMMVTHHQHQGHQHHSLHPSSSASFVQMIKNTNSSISNPRPGSSSSSSALMHHQQQQQQIPGPYQWYFQETTILYINCTMILDVPYITCHQRRTITPCHHYPCHQLLFSRLSLLKEKGLR